MVRILAPVMPKGCPKAMAPPLTFSLASSMFNLRADGITCAAKASLISTKSTSEMLMPARFMACSLAATGPMPMISGLSALTPVDTIRAKG